MSRASGTIRGSAVRIPGTSFHKTACFAPSTRASSVAVKSDPPRPIVVTDPSGVRPMKPGTTAMMRRARSGLMTRRARRAVAGMSGAAPP